VPERRSSPGCGLRNAIIANSACSLIYNYFAEIPDRHDREQRLRYESEDSHRIGSWHKNEQQRQGKRHDGAKSFPTKQSHFIASVRRA
jgi:hypothetical protein